MDEIKAVLTERREFIRIKLGELRDEMNARFCGIEQKIGDHVYNMKESVTDELSLIKCRFVDVVIEFGRQHVREEFVHLAVLTVIEICMYGITMMICHCLTLQLMNSMSR